MSVLLQLLAVAGVIAVMITLRMVVNRAVMRQRLAGRTGKDCEEKECFGGCEGLRPSVEGPAVERPQETKS